jgi:hypothetical protein
MDLAYFAAPDDASAGAAEARPGGPLGWPVVVGSRRTGMFRKEAVVESAGPAYDGFHTRGYDPVVMLGTLEAHMRDVEYDSLEDDPRWGDSVGAGDGVDGRGVVTVTDSLRDALAEASGDELRRTAETWSNTDELRQRGPGDAALADHVEFLRKLSDLSRTAREQGHHLYCYFEL